MYIDDLQRGNPDVKWRVPGNPKWRPSSGGRGGSPEDSRSRRVERVDGDRRVGLWKDSAAIQSTLEAEYAFETF
jgi:hypothetical protein